MYIQDIPKDSKFWVVRSGDGGVFYDHFVHNSIAAIGHIDAMEFSNQTLSNKEEVIKLVHNYKNALGNDSNLLIVFYVQIMPDDFVMQLHRF